MPDPSVKRDYYDVLGVAQGAGESDVKRAFRRLARELHPDVNAHDPEAEAKFKEAAEAYEVLSDPGRRERYDRYGHEGLRAGGWAPPDFGNDAFSGIFEALFGQAGFDPFGGGRAGAMQGGDAGAAVELSLVQAAAGAAVEVSYERIARCEHCSGNGAEPGTPIETCSRCGGSGQLEAVTRTPFGQMMRRAVCDRCGGDGRVAREPCARCRGVGRVAESARVSVDVPAGIEDGQRIRIAGRGHEGERGGPAGDLYVSVRVRADERFVRDGDDLVTVVDIPAPLAALGTTVEIPTLDGSEQLEIVPGTQPSSVIVLRGQGMPALRRRGSGDLRVVVNVVVPRRLSDEQRDLLEQLSSTITAENLRSDENVFQRLKRAIGG
ncbi:MAG: molecular chaperone DnaJ [Solirubrobacterales bacterium]|nr:MAG: molecular chaperone DnaJ [Solirubrobacterales bacterium]